MNFFQVSLMNLRKKTKRKTGKIKELDQTIDILKEKNKSLTSNVDELG